MNTKKIKQKVAAVLILVLLTSKLLVVPAAIFAEEAPTPPAAPTAPTAPENTLVAPTPPAAPTAPTAPENSLVAPTPPTAPTAPIAPTALEVPTAPEAPTAPTVQTILDNPQEDDGVNGSGNVGDTNINTGDGINSSDIATTGNNNIATDSCSACIGGSTSVSNIGNGTGSTNSGSATTSTNNNTLQGNSAVVGNGLNQSTVTGGNNTSFNVGNSSITTGDANTTATVVTAVNTNVDGVMVSEFNIADDHTGDIILDFGANCTQGCGGADLAVNNAGNGAFSTNTSDATSITNNNTSQTNDANIGSNLVLAADSGNNDASFNTGGDSSITTGDANVNANVMTFANNNIAGNVIYGVVNIFGDLVGDIILTEEAMNAACGSSCTGSTTASNIGNGANSSNNANSTNTTNSATFQSNDAEINNTLLIDANTGDNDSSFNTDGNSSIETGDASLTANVLNVVNTNIIGGTWWLVIVNEGGKWVGKILGSPDGSNMAGSEGTEFIVDPVTGEIIASNNGNGANSTNNATVNNETNSNTTQANNAVINNTLDLSANTGGNDANYNTGGNSNIVTGDAKIIANLVNFVNNNITGGGKLVVTVINVFGSWLGDFVAPGQKKNTASTDSSSSNSSQNNSSNNSNASNNSSSIVASAKGEATVSLNNSGSTTVYKKTTFAGGYVKGSSKTNTGSKATVAKSVGQDGSVTVADKKIKVNLAWFLLLIPASLIIYLSKVYFVPVRTLALRGIHMFL